MAQREIVLPTPFDLAGTLRPLQREGPIGELSADRMALAARTPEGAGSVAVAVADGVARAEAWGAGADWLLGALPALLGLYDEPGALAPQHEVVRQAAARHRGLRLPATGLVMESLIPTILGQRVSGLEAARGYRSLMRRFGEDAPGPLGLRLIPDPRRLAAMNYAELHPCGIERSRARTLIAVAKVADRLQAGIDGPRDAWERRIESVRGVGPWTRAHVVGATTGDPDTVPPGDYNLPATVAWALAGERQADDARMFELLEPYAGQRARVLQLLHVAGAGPPRRAPRAAARDFARH